MDTSPEVNDAVILAFAAEGVLLNPPTDDQDVPGWTVRHMINDDEADLQAHRVTLLEGQYRACRALASTIEGPDAISTREIAGVKARLDTQRAELSKKRNAQWVDLCIRALDAMRTRLNNPDIKLLNSPSVDRDALIVLLEELPHRPIPSRVGAFPV